MSAIKTVERMKARVDELITGFPSYLEAFDAAHLFTDPSLYFYLKTLGIRAKYATAADALKDEEFFDGLYATLTAWGMHRPGPLGAKLADLEVIKTSFRQQAERIGDMQHLDCSTVEKAALEELIDKLWAVMDGLRVGAGKTKIVSNSKALHLLLPSLMPPIDRQYTVRFFYHHKTLNRGDEATFREIYPYFHQIATSCQQPIQARLEARKGMDTCAMKVIDNAIVGYVLKHPPRTPSTSLSEDGGA